MPDEGEGFAMKLLFILVLNATWSSVALADLYRWVDPETGSVKFSSYPPPWYGDQAKQRRAPKVDFIPAGRDTSANSEAASAAQDSARRLEAFELQRRQLLQQLAKPGPERTPQELQKQLEAYSALSDQMDKLDPVGAAVRRSEVQVMVERILKGGSR